MFLDTKPPQLQITMSAVVGPCVTKQTAGVLVLMTFGKQLLSCGNESGVTYKEVTRRYEAPGSFFWMLSKHLMLSFYE